MFEVAEERDRAAARRKGSSVPAAPMVCSLLSIHLAQGTNRSAPAGCA
jgi:hypothetical protein